MAAGTICVVMKIRKHLCVVMATVNNGCKMVTAATGVISLSYISWNIEKIPCYVLLLTTAMPVHKKYVNGFSFLYIVVGLREIPQQVTAASRLNHYCTG